MTGTQANDAPRMLLATVEARARKNLARDLHALRAEFRADGPAGKYVRRHPLLSTASAAAVGLAAVIGMRALVRSSGRFLSSLVLLLRASCALRR